MRIYWKKFISAIVLVGLLLSLGGVALACGPGPDQGGRQKPDPQEIERQIGEKLDKLVEDGTISKEQSEKVFMFWREKAKQMRADFEKMRSMSPAERKAYMDEKMKNRPDMVGELERDTGLSESQARAVAEALRPPGPPPPGR